jgi:hypothetical protein
MGVLYIKISGITVENDFEVYYKVGGATPEDHVTGYIKHNSTFSSNTTEINVVVTEYNQQYWFKILDTVNGSYIIENIKTHGLQYFQVECGEISGTTQSNTIFIHVPNS